MAFFSHVPGYYPSSWSSKVRFLSLRIESTKALQQTLRTAGLNEWRRGCSGTVSTTEQVRTRPIQLFLHRACLLAAMEETRVIRGRMEVRGRLRSITTTTMPAGMTDYEVIGPGVFRFEYYYLLKNGRVTDWPWDWRDPQFQNPDQQTITTPRQIGLSQVESIAVAIAVIDPPSRALIQQAASANAAYGDILDIAADLPDFKNANGRGKEVKRSVTSKRAGTATVESIAQNGQTPSGKLIPAEAAKGIRVYNRYFDLKTGEMNGDKAVSYREKGAALIIVLAFVVLLAGVSVAYLSRTTSDRQVAHSSFYQANVDQLAQSAMDTIIGDLRQEIINGSTAFPQNDGTTVYVTRRYRVGCRCEYGSSA